jgi:mRNA interferase RelE/StbE
VTTTWTVEVDDRARRELRRLDRPVQACLLAFLRERIAIPDDPRRLGRPLTGPQIGLWRYRVGAYRLICRIEDARVVVLVVRVAHRRIRSRCHSKA